MNILFMSSTGEFMKKGFTLIEVLSVIIIIGIITTVATLSINYSINRTKERLYVEQIERLETSLKNWGLTNIDNLPINEEGISFYSVKELKGYGIIDTDEVIDPRTGNPMEGCMIIKYQHNINQYVFIYDESDCLNASDDYLPVINIEGGTEHFIEVNSVYKLPKVTAVTYKGEKAKILGPVVYLQENSSIVRKIDTSNVGEKYSVKYTAIDPLLNIERESVLNLTVVDTVRPVISVNGSNRTSEYVIEANPYFEAPIAVVSDNSCGISGVETEYNDCINTLNAIVSTNLISPREPGNYTITYTATDSSLNSRILVLDLVVEDTISPTKPTFELRLNNSSGEVYNGVWTNNNVWMGNLNSTDIGSGVKEYEYSLNCEDETPSWTLYNNPISFSLTMNSRVCVRAIDFVGNVSEVSNVRDVKIDKVLPACTVSGGSSSWFNSNRTITGTCSDSDSGCVVPSVTRTFTVDTNNSYSPGTVCDNAGNCRVCGNAQVRIDKTAPTCTVSGGSSSWFNSNRTITGTCNDSGSGCSSPSVTRTFTTTTDGSFSPGTVCDNVGWCTACGNQTVKIDKDIPTAPSISGGSTTWTNGNRTISISGGNAGPSGRARYEYRTRPSGGSWGSWTTYSSSITYSTTTNIEIQARVVDNAGNNGTVSSTAYVRIDKDIPTAPSISGGSTTWTNGNRTISISGGSAGPSGLARREYRTRTSGGSWGSWTTYSSSITYSTTTNIEIQARVVDSAGNNGTTSSTAYVRIDKTAPSVTRSPSSQSTWGNSNITVTLTGTDSGGSGFRRMRTRLSTDDGSTYGSWSSFTTSNPITRTLSGTGNHRIQIEVEDNAGNTATITTSRYRIDQDTPTAPNTGGTGTAWYNVDRTFTTSGGSAGPSGVARREYRTRTSGGSWGSWTTYSSGITYTSNTNREFQARIIDNAGNTGTATTTRYIRIDKTSPTCSTSGGSTAWTSGNRTLTGSCSDSGGSGCSGNSSRTYSSTINTTTANPGQVCDNAGNCSNCPNATVRIDKTAPSITGITCGYYSSTGRIHVRITASDAHSGLNQTCIRMTSGGVWRCISGSNWITWAASDPGGTLYFNARRASDNVGNEASTGSGSCSVVHYSS